MGYKKFVENYYMVRQKLTESKNHTEHKYSVFCKNRNNNNHNHNQNHNHNNHNNYNNHNNIHLKNHYNHNYGPFEIGFWEESVNLTTP